MDSESKSQVKKSYSYKNLPLQGYTHTKTYPLQKVTL
jgi:hypothetical protein